MADGIAWLLEPYLVDCVTFARGPDPAELAARLGASPDRTPRRASAAEAEGLLADPCIGSVARVGRSGDWSFAVEYGDAVGPTAPGLAAVSRGGAEAVNFLLMPWSPPSMFTYHRDGESICSFGIGEEARRWGQEPDLLVPALLAVGVLPADREVAGGARERSKRLSMLAIEEYFGLRLPRADVVAGELPLFVRRVG
jgi:hypothetical protein